MSTNCHAIQIPLICTFYSPFVFLLFSMKQYSILTIDVQSQAAENTVAEEVSSFDKVEIVDN